MRSTITLEEDVARQVRELMRERGTGFKQTINDLLRRGLRADAPASEPYVVEPFHATIRPGVDLDKALALAAALEDDELIRKVSVGK